MENNDMFRKLPEALLILIISFLPLKDAMMTSLLSKQWLNLWTSTTAIYLDEDHFFDTQRQRRLLGAGRKGWALHIRKTERRRFTEFVCQTLPRFEGPKISKLAIRVGYQIEHHYCIEQWIRFAISKEVEELHLHLPDRDLSYDAMAYDDPQFNLPDFLYSYRTLRVLELDSCKFLPSNFQCFMTLTNLSLRRIWLPDEAIKDVVTNGPFLQNLSLIECSSLYYLKISAPILPLKSLIVRDCLPLSLGIELFAPQLQTFEYCGHIVTFYIDNLESLVNAILDFGLEYKFYHFGVELNDLLQDLSHAKNLTVCSYFLQILPTEESLFNHLPLPLSNMKHLTLMTGFVLHELLGLLCLLRSSPNLETLTIQTGYESYVNGYIYPNCVLMPTEYWVSVRLPFNHLQRLRMVKMEGFIRDTNEMELQKFLLEMALVLEKMIIIRSKEVFPVSDGGTSPSIVRVMEELQNVESASPNVEILCC